MSRQWLARSFRLWLLLLPLAGFCAYKAHESHTVSIALQSMADSWAAKAEARRHEPMKIGLDAEEMARENYSAAASARDARDRYTIAAAVLLAFPLVLAVSVAAFTWVWTGSPKADRPPAPRPSTSQPGRGGASSPRRTVVPTWMRRYRIPLLLAPYFATFGVLSATELPAGARVSYLLLGSFLLYSWYRDDARLYEQPYSRAYALLIAFFPLLGVPAYLLNSRIGWSFALAAVSRVLVSCILYLVLAWVGYEMAR